MRTRLLASLAVAVWLWPTATPAVTPVIDALEIAHTIAELNQLIEQYRILFCSNQQIQQVMFSLQHANPNIMALAPGLQSGQMRLPGSGAPAIPGLNFGSVLSQAGAQAYQQNHYYTASGSDFAATEMQRQAMATANIQGEAATGMQTANQRIGQLSQLEASISGQPDVQALNAVHARIAAERLYLANESNNTAQLRTMLATQRAVADQRAQQNFRMQVDQWQATAAQQAGMQ